MRSFRFEELLMAVSNNIVFDFVKLDSLIVQDPLLVALSSSEEENDNVESVFSSIVLLAPALALSSFAFDDLVLRLDILQSFSGC